MLDRFASSFERKFLFGFGRHFWNVVGVAGVVAIAVGGVSLVRSFSPIQQVVGWCDWIKERDASFDCRGKTTVLPSGAKLTSPSGRTWYVRGGSRFLRFGGLTQNLEGFSLSVLCH